MQLFIQSGMFHGKNAFLPGGQVMGELMEFDYIDRLCGRKMLEGKKKHGLLNLETDPRHWPDEMKEELIDAINYCRFAKAKFQLDERLADEIVVSLKNILKLLAVNI